MIAICVHRRENINFFYSRGEPLLGDSTFITKKEELTVDKLTGMEWVFFIDWSWKIPKEIYEKYQCVVLHAADLPNFRGGSPVQNQIIRGIKKTKLTAFMVNEGLDTGDILLQRDLSLEGHIGEIWRRICVTATLMIIDITKGNYERHPQEGGGSYYERRAPDESELPASILLKSLQGVYDFIRMLEDPYPNAYVERADKKITFKTADFDGKKIRGTYEIE